MNVPGRLSVTIILFIAIALAATLASTFVSPPHIYANENSRIADARPYVVRISAHTAAERQRLASRGLDLLEQRTDTAIFALASEAQQRALRAEGWEVTIDAAQSASANGVRRQDGAFRNGYRTIAEIEDFLHSTAEAYPDLSELVDYGDSWEKSHYGDARGHELWAIRLTNKAIAGPKPVFLLVAAIHPREIVTSELATRYIDYLLKQYGHDADVTWLLNEREVVIIPLANPDGKALVEQGYLQRKNTNTSDTHCTVPPTANNQLGVDLNRNFSFAWGKVNDPETPPCSETFPGTAAASEPETAALQVFLRHLFPDQQGALGRSTIADTTNGVMISLHSYSNLVLWPWGYSNISAPNSSALERLGKKLAAFNEYTPQQSFDLYATSGTLEDWLYGERGVASYTFEVGPTRSGSCANFFPPIECLDGKEDGRFWPRNLPAFIYATRIAAAPYTMPAGPDITNVRVVHDTQQVTITATIDSRANGRVVHSAAVSIQQPPWDEKSTISLLPRDGIFDSSLEAVYAVLPRERITPFTLFLLQGKSDTWGAVNATWAMPYEERDYALARPAIWLPMVRKR